MKFLGVTGTVDFDAHGLRRSIQLKVLEMSEQGMIEIGTWSHSNRLSLTPSGIQFMTTIKKHLQVVTREVIRKYRNESFILRNRCL